MELLRDGFGDLDMDFIQSLFEILAIYVSFSHDNEWEF
jgi:hypothetical protein